MPLFPKMKFEIKTDKRDLLRFLSTPFVLKQTIMFDIEKEVLRFSPVDTRRFRSSWIASVKTPSNEDPINKKRQVQYRTEGKQFRRRPQHSGKNVWNQKTKDTFFLSNNVPYGTLLAKGWSDQAPPGWIETAVRRGVRLAINKVNRRR